MNRTTTHRQALRRTVRRPAACALVIAASLTTPCRANPDYPLESELARLAGRSARQCGIFRLDDPAPAGWQCARAAERAGQPYWLAFMGPGEDSMVGHAALRTPGGEHLVLHYDSDPRGGGSRPRNPHIETTRCRAGLDFRAGKFPYFACATP